MQARGVMSILRIRESQMRALRDTTTVFQVEGGLVKLFPEQCQQMSSSVRYQLAESSIDHARAFGFDPEHYLGFAALRLTFGEYFWEEEEYAWARDILQDPWLWTPAQRMHELRQASVRYLAALAEEEPR
jgi:hypothetical protein